jgi:glycosyltransferase involved in cell wall biosynthesis
VEPGDDAYSVTEADVRARYELAMPYFYLPNQFWRHKNHAVMIEALRILRDQNVSAMVVASGASTDPRHPRLFEELVEQVRRQGLAGVFRFLRFIPRADVYALMRGSIAVVNPSLFEGWSTTVEEAKAIGVPLVLSDIPVHREQTAGAADYFDPQSPQDAAAALARAVDSSGDTAGVPPRADARMANAERLGRYARCVEDLIEGVAEDAS